MRDDDDIAETLELIAEKLAKLERSLKVLQDRVRGELFDEDPEDDLDDAEL